MYKSILGAVGLFSLLLFLCAANPATALAGATNHQPQTVTVALDRRQPMTNTIRATTVPTTGQLFVKGGVIQNQRILEVPSLISQAVALEFAAISVTQQILYQRDDIVGILATTSADPTGNNIDEALQNVVFAQQNRDIGNAVNISNFATTSDVADISNTIAISNIFNLSHPIVTFSLRSQPEPLPRSSDKPLVVGNPHGVGAMPLGIPITTNLSSADLLLEQWALGQTTTNAFGIDLYQKLGLTRTTNATGAQVRIVIFDTSPFTFSNSAGQVVSHSGVVTTTLGIGIFRPLVITVTNTLTQPCPSEIRETAPVSFTVDIRSHGLFAAALAYAVAPEATIELVQVLDNNGCGTTTIVTQKLNELITAYETNPIPTVINLSLGVLDGHDSVENLSVLSTTLTAARNRGIVIVAAAGNNISPTNTLLMQPPASHQAVIGVGASNAQGGFSCFSKRVVKALGPRIVAPGGDAWIENQCNAQEKIRRCTDKRTWLSFWERVYKIFGQDFPNIPNDECSNLVLGMILNPITGDFEYANWMGTSFATPIVSGWAALELENKSLDVIYEALTPSIPATPPPPNPPDAAAPVCLPRASMQLQSPEICVR